MQQLQEILENKGGELVPGLIDSFFEEAPQLIAAASQALEAGRATELCRAAHTLKSNSRDFGAVALAEVAHELETQAKEGVPAGAAVLIARLDEEFAKAQPILAASDYCVLDRHLSHNSTFLPWHWPQMNSPGLRFIEKHLDFIS